jgi:2-oxoglutarate ferredoxin oxidoreductase subunit alpha
MRIGLLELQTIWPFPDELVREKCRNAHYIIVVEMNNPQVVREVMAAVDEPQRVFLANRVDGNMITPSDIKNVIRIVQGKGV